MPLVLFDVDQIERVLSSIIKHLADAIKVFGQLRLVQHPEIRFAASPTDTTTSPRTKPLFETLRKTYLTYLFDLKTHLEPSSKRVLVDLGIPASISNGIDCNLHLDRVSDVSFLTDRKRLIRPVVEQAILFVFEILWHSSHLHDSNRDGKARRHRVICC